MEGVFEAVGRFANGLLAGADAGVLALGGTKPVPKWLVDGAAGVAPLSACCADAPNWNAGVGAVAFGVACAPVPNAPNMLFWGCGVSAPVSLFCPKPPNMFGGAAAGC